MPDVFVMLAAGRIEIEKSPGTWLIPEVDDLLIFVDGILRVTLNRRRCTIEGVIPETLALATVGRRLAEVIDPEILSWCPGSADATVTDVPNRPCLDEYQDCWKAHTTILAITPIDVREAMLHHVAWPAYNPDASAENGIRKAFLNPQRPRPLVRYDKRQRIRPTPQHGPMPH